MKRLMITVAMVLAPLEAFAVGEEPEVTPPYYKRVLLSLGSLFPAAIVLGLLMWGIHYYFDRETARQRKWLWLGSVVVLMCAASLTAALQAEFCDYWNPRFTSSAVLGLMAPASLYILNKRFTGVWRGVVFVPALVACVLAAVLLTEWWVLGITSHRLIW